MKAIFLDIDGVFNSSQTFMDNYNIFKQTGIKNIEIDENMVINLKKIVELTNAKLVLTSSWRVYYKKVNGILTPIDSKSIYLNNILNKHSLKLYDMTPYDINRDRSKEISNWLSNNCIDKYIIIDDENVKGFDNHLVKTNFGTYNELETELGLCEKHVIKSINLLK